MEVLDAMEAIGTAVNGGHYQKTLVGYCTTNNKQIWWLLHSLIYNTLLSYYIPFIFYRFCLIFALQIISPMTNQVWNETICCSASAAKNLTGLWNRRWKDASLACRGSGKCQDVMVAWPGKLVCGSRPQYPSNQVACSFGTCDVSCLWIGRSIHGHACRSTIVGRRHRSFWEKRPF